MSGKKANATKSFLSTKSQAQGDALVKAIQWIVNDKMFSSVKLHGNTNWSPSKLVGLAVLAAIGDGMRMTDNFSKAARLSDQLFGSVAVQTFQGMVRALVRYSPALVACLWLRFQLLMQKVAPQYYRIGKWLPLAVDGSRFSTPRTRSNEKKFAAKKYGHGAMARSRARWKNKKRRSKKLGAPVKPQIWLTLVWHMGVKLPWCWKMGPSNSSERDHLLELIETQDFPENTLFCGDAGFTGYEFWQGIVNAGHSFLFRVGSNIRLLNDLGHARSGDGIVCLWPDQIAKRKQPPIVLRLIEITNEQGTMYLVTNVLDQRQLSNRSLRKLYPLRWGIELHFRAVKQTYHRRKLKSRNADHALVELEWSLITLTMIQLLAIREHQSIDIQPQQASIALAISAVRNALETWSVPVTMSQRLKRQLQNAIQDDYERKSSKTGRYLPSFKDKPSTKPPVILAATKEQKQKYRDLIKPA